LGLRSIPCEIRKDTPPKKATKAVLEPSERPHFFGASLVTGQKKERKIKLKNQFLGSIELYKMLLIPSVT